MDIVERRLEVSSPKMRDDADPRPSDDERAHLLGLAAPLAEPELDVELRLDLAERMCEVLNRRTPLEETQPMKNESGGQPRAPR